MGIYFLPIRLNTSLFNYFWSGDKGLCLGIIHTPFSYPLSVAVITNNMHLGVNGQGIELVVSTFGNGHGWSFQNLGFTGTCYQVAKVENPGVGVSTAGQMYFYITRITGLWLGNSGQKHFLTSAAHWNHHRGSTMFQWHEMSKSCLVSPAVQPRGGLPGWDVSWGLTGYQLRDKTLL